MHKDKNCLRYSIIRSYNLSTMMYEAVMLRSFAMPVNLVFAWLFFFGGGLARQYNTESIKIEGFIEGTIKRVSLLSGYFPQLKSSTLDQPCTFQWNPV